MSGNGRKRVTDHPLYRDPQFSSAFEKIKHKFYVDVPRDGNCFYRSFAELQEKILNSREERHIFLNHTEMFEKANISPVVYETYTESIAEMPYLRVPEDITGDEWDLIVGYLRLTAGAYVKTHPEEFSDFVGDVERYTASNIDPMGQRAGEVEVIAICRAFSCQIQMVSILNNEYKSVKYSQGPTYTILHTPDHFEPLYEND
ncbi:hypothetical protein PAEPH01_0330 [Pancytospora epiphaga]|nr:hypothetical protein PAEPH01_0330 [Pancytospora epiphaga]